MVRIFAILVSKTNMHRGHIESFIYPVAFETLEQCEEELICEGYSQMDNLNCLRVEEFDIYNAIVKTIKVEKCY